MMTIELRGVEFVNKGAELMLHAIMQRVKSRFPDARFVMETSGRSPREKLKEHGIFTKTNLKFKKVPLQYVLDLFPTPLLKKYSFIRESEVNVVLDASGFAFGDKWGAEKAGYRMANHVERWKGQKKSVVMLPQALGPFSKNGIAEKMKTITANADLIFARDKTSFGYISELSVKDNIRLSPDFTNLIGGSVPAYYDPKVHDIAIIPNDKMIETSNAEDSKKYLLLLKNVVKQLKQINRSPYFLIHESTQDLHIVTQVNDSLSDTIPVVQEEDALKVKGLIGKSNAVVTSRFHGLVSSLSQAVPCLATGWSHKYEMLLLDYDYNDALLSLDISESDLLEKIKQITDEDQVKRDKSKLKSKSIEQKKLSEKMWDQVFAVIDQN